MPAQQPDMRSRHRENRLAMLKMRLFNPSTRKFLHLSGSGETRSEAYAWFGFQRQAQALLDQANIQGEDFPYELVAPGTQERAV